MCLRKSKRLSLPTLRSDRLSRRRGTLEAAAVGCCEVVGGTDCYTLAIDIVVVCHVGRGRTCSYTGEVAVEGVEAGRTRSSAVKVGSVGVVLSGRYPGTL